MWRYCHTCTTKWDPLADWWQLWDKIMQHDIEWTIPSQIVVAHICYKIAFHIDAFENVLAKCVAVLIFFVKFNPDNVFYLLNPNAFFQPSITTLQKRDSGLGSKLQHRLQVLQAHQAKWPPILVLPLAMMTTWPVKLALVLVSLYYALSLWLVALHAIVLHNLNKTSRKRCNKPIKNSRRL